MNEQRTLIEQKILNSNSNVDEELLKEYVSKVKSCENEDPETSHRDADNYLCELLTKLGYGQVVEQFENINKWYA